MGNKGASSKKVGAGARTQAQTSSTQSNTPSVFKESINKQKATQDFLETQNPQDFISLPPDTITLDGVEFKNIVGNPHVYDGVGKREYKLSYQATEKIGGEYSVFDVVVVEKKTKKGLVKHEFDKSYLGTRFI